MDYNYDVYTVTEDGIELWKENLTYREARNEVEKARNEFGGKYWIEKSTGNPFHKIPDVTPQ